MNQIQRDGLAARYQNALRVHLHGSGDSELETAHDLGVQAVSMGMGMLDLANLHATSVLSESAPGRARPQRKELNRRAAAFFTEVILPIEETHRIALDLNAELMRLNGKLADRTVKLVSANHALQSKFAKHQAAEVTLRERAETSCRLLEESRQLQKQLHLLNRQMLTAQECDRKKMSLRLQDDIAQTLLGIHVRLLAIGKELSAASQDFRNEIAKTERLVAMSVRTIHRFTREFGIANEN